MKYKKSCTKKNKRARRKRGGMEAAALGNTTELGEPKEEQAGEEMDEHTPWSAWKSMDYLKKPDDPRVLSIYNKENDWSFRPGDRGFENFQDWKIANPIQVRFASTATGQVDYNTQLYHAIAKNLYNDGWRIYNNEDGTWADGGLVVRPEEGGGMKKRKKKTRKKRQLTSNYILMDITLIRKNIISILNDDLIDKLKIDGTMRPDADLNSKKVKEIVKNLKINDIDFLVNKWYNEHYPETSSIKTKNKIGGNGDDNICAICHENLNISETKTLVGCGHIFHNDCIGMWFETSRTCPICRNAEPIRMRERLAIFIRTTLVNNFFLRIVRNEEPLRQLAIELDYNFIATHFISVGIILPYTGRNYPAQIPHSDWRTSTEIFIGSFGSAALITGGLLLWARMYPRQDDPPDDPPNEPPHQEGGRRKKKTRKYKGNKYPYKNITKKEAITDFIKLKTTTNPRSLNGLEIVNYGTEKLRVRTKYRGKSLIQRWKDKKARKTLKKFANRLYKGSYTDSLLHAYRSAIALSWGTLSSMRTSAALQMYKKYNAKKVLDFTAGWGSRMTAALAADIDYIGIDSNKSLKKGYNKILKATKKHTKSKVKLFFQPAETVNYSKLDYDFVFTSPPYEYLELYEHMKNYDGTKKIKQAHSANDKRRKNDGFYDTFLIPTIKEIYKHLPKGKWMCLNVPDLMYDKIKKKWKACNKKEDYMISKRVGSNMKSDDRRGQEFVYCWKK